MHRWSAQGPDAPDYAHVVATKDHHVDPGEHWADEPDFVDSWPVHCKVGTDGEAFHPNLDPLPFDAIFLKGEHVAAYSGFEGVESERPGPGRLAARPRGRGHRRVRPRHRPLRARHRPRRRPGGFRHPVLHDLCAGVAPDTTEAALAEMKGAGVTLR